MLAKAAAIAAHRSGRHTQQARAGEVRHHLRPCAGNGVVRLVNHHQLEELPRQQVQPSRQGLDAGHLHRMAQVHTATGSDAAMRDTHRRQAAAGLVQQLLAVHEDADAVALARGGLGDVAEYVSLAPASGQHRQHLTMTQLVLQADVGDQLLLVGAEVHSGRLGW